MTRHERNLWLRGSILAMAALLALLMVLVFALRPEAIHPPEHYFDSPYDLAQEPITDGAIHSEIISNYQNIDLTLFVFRQATIHFKVLALYDAMVELRNKFPKDPIVMAEFCVAYNHAQGALGYGQSDKIYTQTEQDVVDYAEIVKKLPKVAPHLWLTPVVELQNDRLIGSNPVEAHTLIAEAERLAPNDAWLHWYAQRVFAYSLSKPDVAAAHREQVIGCGLKPVILNTFESRVYSDLAAGSVLGPISKKLAQKLKAEQLPVSRRLISVIPPKLQITDVQQVFIKMAEDVIAKQGSGLK